MMRSACLMAATLGLLAGPFPAIGAASAEERSCPAEPPQVDFPTQPITFVAPTSAGSGAARYVVLLAENMQKLLNQPIEVVYKPAGANNAAATHVDEAPADGHTISMGHGSLAGYINLPSFQPDPDNFLYIAQTEKQLFALAVPADSQFKTMEDVIAYAKKNPAKLALGSTKVGSVHHRHIINLESATGAKFLYTPYKGSGDIARDVISGHIPIGLAQPGVWLPHVAAGKVRMLLLLNEERIPRLPDVPVPSDLGYKYEFTHHWYGVMVKRGTPKDRVAKLQWAIGKVTDSDAYRRYLERNPHIFPDVICDEAFLTARMKKDVSEMHDFLKEHGIIN